MGRWLWTGCSKDGQTAGPIDVILTDIRMPVMDGGEATQRIRQAGYRGPIIALTAHAMKEDQQRCLEVGCDDHLTKPIHRDRLMATVAHHLQLATTAIVETGPCSGRQASF
jgi:CheY-like chemotaxis protein